MPEKKKLFSVFIPTTGHVVYEVKAYTAEAAISLVREGSGRLIEEGSGDWKDEDDWEVEECDE